MRIPLLIFAVMFTTAALGQTPFPECLVIPKVEEGYCFSVSAEMEAKSPTGECPHVSVEVPSRGELSYTIHLKQAKPTLEGCIF